MDFSIMSANNEKVVKQLQVVIDIKTYNKAYTGVGDLKNLIDVFEEVNGDQCKIEIAEVVELKNEEKIPTTNEKNSGDASHNA